MKVRFQADADLNQIISQKLPIAQVSEELMLIWMSSEAEEGVNRMYMLPL